MVYSITVVVFTLKFTCVVFGTVLAPLTTLSLLHRRKKAPEENLGSLLNTSFVNNHSKLLNDGSYTTGTNGSTTLTYCDSRRTNVREAILYLISCVRNSIGKNSAAHFLHTFQSCPPS